MLTLKQIEAMYWVHVLGSYQDAAERLHATQSTISKRVLDLEESLGVRLFEPRNRTELTLRGREVLPDVERMLELQRSIVQRITDANAYTGTFRLGVTEMVALTWLPALVSGVHAAFPQIHLEPVVSLTSDLWPQMLNHRLDMIICPQSVPDEHPYQASRLDDLSSVWMARPGLVRQGPQGVSVEEMLAQPLLTYSQGSLLHERMVQVLAQAGHRGLRIVHCNSMIALAELARAGLGVTCLPLPYFDSYVQAGDLEILHCALGLPALEYKVIHRSDIVSQRVLDIARTTCDFRRPPRGA